MAGLRQFFAGWRGLGRFWLITALLLGTGVGALQFSGGRQTGDAQPDNPAPAPQAAVQAPPAPPPPTEPAKPVAQAAAKPPVPAAQRPGRDTPGPVADPDPALLEAASGADTLPRIALDGRMPMQVYAGGFDSSSRRPRVGFVLAGLGLNQAESEAAIRALPGGVTLAFSPYAQNTAKLLSAARAAGHEYLVSIPMEPQGFPLSDPGKQALMTSVSLDQNRTRLAWILSRFAGYAGAIGAEGAMRGERYASLPGEMDLMLGELARRGLLYIDPRPGAAPVGQVWSRMIDVVVDEPPTAADIDDKLARLTRLARENGSALGFAGTVRPVTTQRLVAWTADLTPDGLALAPVSALVQAPAAR